MDQKVYDELIAQGKSERIARAKAKAATVRAKKEAAGEKVGPREAGDTPAAAPAAAASAGGAPAAAAGGGVATTDRSAPVTGGMSPEERQKRVAAALAARGNGGAPAATETKYAGQAHTHRLLAMVPPTGIQQIRAKQEDKVYTWPHLLGAEFIALLACTALLTILSLLPAFPLRELANPNITPNPSKAPWYFLGLQELLRYFHPMIAGVTIPGIVGLLGLMTIPFLDKNPSVRPENRKTAITLMTFFLVGSGMMTMVGSFFRGPGFNWVWPWIDGLFFEL
ncbi:MAG: menaquinol-cytochrome c reductase cytochrome b subunit [Nitriliruptorales bacterium]|nr:menaquinol-cytochrome c reductase cytochrome b subunit [Nitriliruptorales bacterium]